jgi:hypothetical protein
MLFNTEALRLEELLADYGMAVRVGRASISADRLLFPLQLGLGTTVRRMLGLTQQVAEAAGYSRANLRREGQNLFLELSCNDGAGLRYGDLLEMVGAPSAGNALIGLLDGGEPLVLSLARPTSQNLLVCGVAGTGKSELLRIIALGMAAHHAPRRLRVALLGSRARSPLAPLRTLPHCFAWSAEPEAAIGWLVRLQTELEEREQQQTAGPPLLVLLDDAGDVLKRGGEVVQAVLRTLLHRGAAVGIHLVLACQSLAQVDDLLPLLDTRLMAEEKSLPGRFLLWGGGLHPLPVTVARLDSHEALSVVERLRDRRSRVFVHSLQKEDV